MSPGGACRICPQVALSRRQSETREVAFASDLPWLLAISAVAVWDHLSFGLLNIVVALVFLFFLFNIYIII